MLILGKFKVGATLLIFEIPCYQSCVDIIQVNSIYSLLRLQQHKNITAKLQEQNLSVNYSCTENLAQVRTCYPK